MTFAKLPLLGFALLAGCIARSAEPQPAMTAAEHEAEARRAEQIAQQHDSRRDPGLYATQRCGNFAGPVGTPGGFPQVGAGSPNVTPPMSPLVDPCGSAIQAERDHELEAERLRWIAAKHRASAARLRSEEARACQGLSTEEMLAGPLDQPEDVVAVQALPDYGRTGKASSQRGGATVLLKKEPGVSAEQLKDMLVCDAARASVQGGRERTPWAVPGASIAVTDEDGNWLVEVSADDRETAREIIKRARALRDAPQQ